MKVKAGHWVNLDGRWIKPGEIVDVAAPAPGLEPVEEPDAPETAAEPEAEPETKIARRSRKKT